MWKFLNKESLLHQALLDKDLIEIKKLSTDKKLLNSKNGMEFTPLEVAFLLNYSDAVAILHPEPQKVIKVLHEGLATPLHYSPLQFRKTFGVHYLSHLKFESYSELKKVIHNCPWILRSWLGAENRDLGLKYQKEIEKGFVIESTIKWIDSKIGYGLFADKDVKAGEYIGEYTGKVRSLSRSNPDHNKYCFQYPTRFWGWNYYVVDALAEGNELRFINHSFDPNLEPICLLDRGLLHIGFIANQDIPKGAEFTFNYGPDFWSR